VSVVTGGGPDTKWKARGMFDLPHVDGQFVFGAAQLASSSPNLVLTRAAKGNWALERTAAGAETYYASAQFNGLTRLGEVENNQDFFGANPNAPVKGIYITNIFASYIVGVENLTSATLRLGKTIYANSTAPAVTDILAATSVGAGNLVAAATPWLVSLPVTSPVYITDPNVLWEVEFSPVLANTGTIAIEMVGFTC
jgi:hypothetical protein